jgi:hypothetical protein
MRLMLISASAAALFAGSALADEVIIHRDAAPPPGAMIEHRSADVPADATKEKTITHDADGCTTKSVTKSNGEGDTMSKSKTNC